MRVVWVLDSLKLGGAERLAVRIAAQPPPGLELRLIALQPDPSALAAPPGAETLAMRRLRDAREWLRFCRLLRRWRPQLLHSHLRYATVWTALASTWLRLPHVATLHQLPQPASESRQRWLGRCEQRALRAADRVVFVSAAQAAAWKAPPDWRTCVLPNGASPVPPLQPRQRAERRLAWGIPADACLFVTVAVVRPRKGWRAWVSAANAVAALQPQAWFAWVGGGPDFAALEAAATDAPHSARLGLAGPRTDVAEWLQMADVFLFPSEEEALPTAVIEAMAAGLPIIASDLPAVREVLGECGLLIPVADATELARAALSLCGERGPAARAPLAAAARRRFELHFSEPMWHARLMSLYNELLPAQARPGRGQAV